MDKKILKLMLFIPQPVAEKNLIFPAVELGEGESIWGPPYLSQTVSLS